VLAGARALQLGPLMARSRDTMCWCEAWAGVTRRHFAVFIMARPFAALRGRDADDAWTGSGLRYSAVRFTFLGLGDWSMSGGSGNNMALLWGDVDLVALGWLWVVWPDLISGRPLACCRGS